MASIAALLMLGGPWALESARDYGPQLIKLKASEEAWNVQQVWPCTTIRNTSNELVLTSTSLHIMLEKIGLPRPMWHV